MKNTLIRIISALLCVALAATVLISASAVETESAKAGDINGDQTVDNKDVVALFRHLNGDTTPVDEIACDTNGDGFKDNKDVVALFRYLSGTGGEIFYGTQGETEETTEPDETTDPPVEYDNVFTEWDDSVASAFSDAKQSDYSLTKDGLKLKYTGTGKTADPRIVFDVSKYAKIKNKKSITGVNSSFIVVKVKSNTDGDFQIFTKSTGGDYKTASYKPDGEFHYIIFDMSTTKLVQESTVTAIRIDWGSGKTQTGAEALITEMGFFDTLDDALDYTGGRAGTDSGIVRDGTPKKYVTMSFDDGTQQDLRIIEILKKYNVLKATFFINTGLCGADWTAALNGIPHVRFTMDELKTGIYDGFNVECHTLNHPSLKSYDNNVAQLKKEIISDSINIFNLTGYYPAGLAWPGGDGDQTETTRKLVYENTNLRYGRGIQFNSNFKLPKEFLLWEPSCSMSGSGCITLFKRFLKKTFTEDALFYGFAHGFEFDSNNSWETFEEFIKLVSEANEAGDIVLVTNADFYQLFKDEIPSFVPTT